MKVKALLKDYSGHFHTIGQDQTVKQALKLMSAYNVSALVVMIKAKIRHLPVLFQGQIKGMLCLEDLAKKHVRVLTQELHYLKDYISDLQDAAHD